MSGITFRLTLIAACCFIVSGCPTSQPNQTTTATPTPPASPTLPKISSDPVSAAEGGPASGNFISFVLELSAAYSQTVNVDYTTADLTAKAGEDYIAKNGTVSFIAGETEVTINIAIIGDSVEEANEDLTLLLSDPQNATTVSGTTGTILDDDSTRRLSIDNATANESDGQIVFTVNLDQASGNDITVDFDTTDGSALAASDYSDTSDSLTIPSNATTGQITISVTDDDTPESSESFTVQLSNPSTDVIIARATGTGTITDDDTTTPPPPSSLDAELIDDAPTANRCDFIDPNYCLFPWPNNHFTVADSSTATGLRVNLDPASMPRNSAGKPLVPTEWNRNDGFSLNQHIIARVENLDLVQTDAPLLTNIQRSLDNDSPILLLNATTGQRHLIFAEIDANLTKFGPCDGFSPGAAVAGILAGALDQDAVDEFAEGANRIKDECDGQGPTAPDEPGVDPGPALMIRPMINLTEGHRYIVALRNLKDSSGNDLMALPEFQVCRDSVPSLIPQVTARCAALDQAFVDLDNHGVNRSELFLAWDFTAISRDNMVERMIHIRDDALLNDLNDTTPSDGVVNGDAPNFEITSFEDLNGGNIARRVRGRIAVPCYLDTANCAPGGKFFYQPGPGGPNGDDLPDRQTPLSVQQTAFVCNIPRVAFNNVADATSTVGVTTVRPSLYGHGLLGSRNESNSGNILSMAQNQQMMFCATDWYGMASGELNPSSSGYDSQVDIPPGGDIGNVGSILVDMSNFGTLVDRVQQGMLAFIYLGRAMIHPDGFSANAAFQDANGTSVIDTRELFYDGNSQGGIIGGPLVAVSPDIRAGVLGVPGQSYSMLLRRSVDFDQYAAFFYSSYRSSLDQTFILSLIQMLWDRSESSGYMHYLRAGNHLDAGVPKRVILHPAFGDHQVTVWTADQMARTIGAKVHCPAIVTGSSPAGEQITPAVLSGVHPDVDAEAVKFEAESGTGLTHPRRRHPDDIPYFGLECIDYSDNGNNGHNGNALIVWDRGPLTNDRNDGTTSPPTDNTPPRPELGYGGDPHSDPRNDSESQRQKGNFLRTLNPSTGDGLVINVCGNEPCATREFDPTP